MSGPLSGCAEVAPPDEAAEVEAEGKVESGGADERTRGRTGVDRGKNERRDQRQRALATLIRSIALRAVSRVRCMTIIQ
jgi:hypothetical protein